MRKGRVCQEREDWGRRPLIFGGERGGGKRVAEKREEATKHYGWWGLALGGGAGLGRRKGPLKVSWGDIGRAGKITASLDELKETK